MEWNNTEKCEYPTCDPDEALPVWIVCNEVVISAWYKNPNMNDFWFESEIGLELAANLWVEYSEVKPEPPVTILK